MSSRFTVYYVAGFVLSLILSAGLIWAAGEQEIRMAAWRSQSAAQSIEVGAELYENNCASCHGINGEGIGELGPALSDATFFFERIAEVGWQGTLKDYVHGTITLGRVTATRPLYAGDGTVVVMSPWGKAYGGPLRPDEINDITAFVLNWKASAAGEFTPPEVTVPTMVPVSSTEKVARGKELFGSAGCANCHQQGTGPDLSNVAEVAETRLAGYSGEAYLRESILIPNAFRVEGYAEDVVCGGVVSRTQMEDLTAYLLSLRD